MAQDVFVQFARRRPCGLHAAKTWLYTAAVRAALNAVRARRRRAERQMREFRLSASLERSREGTGDPQEILERRQEALMLRAALARIGRSHAQILALRYGGLSYREIAEIAGVRADQVGTRLVRAERALKREIEREPSR